MAEPLQTQQLALSYLSPASFSVLPRSVSLREKSSAKVAYKYDWQKNTGSESRAFLIKKNTESLSKLCTPNQC